MGCMQPSGVRLTGAPLCYGETVRPRWPCSYGRGHASGLTSVSLLTSLSLLDLRPSSVPAPSSSLLTTGLAGGVDNLDEVLLGRLRFSAGRYSSTATSSFSNGEQLRSRYPARLRVPSFASFSKAATTSLVAYCHASVGPTLLWTYGELDRTGGSERVSIEVDQARILVGAGHLAS